MTIQILTKKEEKPYFNKKEKVAATLNDSVINYPIGHKADEIRLYNVCLNNKADCEKLISLIKNAKDCFIK